MQTAIPTPTNFVEVYPGITLRTDGIIAVKMQQIDEIAFGKRYNVWVETRMDGNINILATKNKKEAEACYHIVRTRLQCMDAETNHPTIDIRHSIGSP